MKIPEPFNYRNKLKIFDLLLIGIFYTIVFMILWSTRFYDNKIYVLFLYLMGVVIGMYLPYRFFRKKNYEFGLHFRKYLYSISVMPVLLCVMIYVIDSSLSQQLNNIKGVVKEKCESSSGGKSSYTVKCLIIETKYGTFKKDVYSSFYNEVSENDTMLIDLKVGLLRTIIVNDYTQ